MGLIYDMEVRKDVKGGSPKTPPRGASASKFNEYVSDQAEKISGWTVDTLHAHILKVMDERDRRYQQLAESQGEAVTTALTSAETAVVKSERIAEKWRENANEWRSAMNDKDRQYLTKDVAKGYFVAGLMAAGVMIAVAELFIKLIFR